MTVTAVTHLNFRGDARAALGFYREVFGGELSLFTYRDMDAVEDPAEAEQLVWGQVDAENGFRVMAYDVPSSRLWSRGEDPFFVSLRGDSADEITALWKRLADGATVAVPLAPSPWAPLYGMLTDRFGVTWVVDIAAARP
ncbi:VOC family protein [Phytomonospora endophytica]|uniref:PhnB protein n=1 Tax=Phytomonospora endophytica TaxID=714109 RepID=A0A841FKM6_9ACTN|nr:VOC family protein [Phytomonospora endophytica]MBB6036716.1 PhnB protein [Phytomonospora endophytica]GIG68250.1 VOC family protein [Phytomonospora endophytica]